MVKKIRRYLYSFWRNSRTWRTHRQTDGRTPGDGNSRAMHSIARQKRYKIELHLQWRTNRKSYMIYQTAPFSMTLNNP